jgi:hypothetical protein
VPAPAGAAPYTPPSAAYTPPPPQLAQPPVFAAPTPPTPQVFAPPSAPAKSKAPIWIVVGALALAGSGAGVYFATRDDKKAVANEPDKPDPDDREEPDEPPPNPDDPWADKNGPAQPDSSEDNAAPPAEDTWAPKGRPPVKPKLVTIGTDATPIPKGAKLRAPAGFTSTITDEAHIYLNATKGEMIALAPLFAGTNDPQKLGEMWVAQTGVTATGSMKIMSAGKLRPALGFSGEAPDGTPINQVIVLYIEPGYRVGVLYAAPSTRFTDNGFQREVMNFFAKSVVLP